MKKVLSAFLALVMALSIGTMNVFAATSIKDDYCPNGKISTPSAPYVLTSDGKVTVWVAQPPEILELGSEIMMNSGNFYNSNYYIYRMYAYKEVDLSVDGGAWFSTTDKAVNSELFNYDTSFMTGDINDVYTIDKLIGIPVIDAQYYTPGDSTNNGILDGKVSGSKNIDYANHEFSFRVRYRLEIEYESGSKETVYSDWSAATSVGKGAASQTQPTLSSKPATPVINVVESFINPFSGEATFYVGVDVPDSVYQDELHYITTGTKPGFYTQTQYKLEDGEWTDAGVGVPEEDKAGSTIDDFFSFIIPGAADGAKVQVRVRTVEPDGRVSEWSNVASLEVNEEYVNPNPKKYGSGKVTPAKPEPAIKTMTEGANEAQVDKFIQSLRSEADPKGTKFSFLVARQKKVTNNSITFTWNKAKKASYYVVYGAKCGKTAYKKIKKIKTNTFTQKKLKKGTYYKYVVAAFDKNGKLLGSCNTLHIATKGGKVCNFKKVTTAAKKNSVTLAKKGKTFKLKAKSVKENSKLTVKTHRTIRYESTNKKIATVDKTGKITAKKKGTCYVYAYAQNGINAKIKVTVKK